MEFMNGAMDPIGTIALCLICAGILIWLNSKKSDE
jgi:hypothetical protein